MRNVYNEGYLEDPGELLRPDDLTVGNTTVMFTDLREKLIRHIRAADGVAGCVAWLTESSVLAALAETPCHIAVQKEDFLRPDSGGYWKAKLRSQYQALTSLWEIRFDMPLGAGFLSYSGDPSNEPIRCVGNHNSEAHPGMPRMHHKFLVFLHRSGPGASEVKPKAVWTGSFNFSRNATESLENAVYIEDEQIAEAYLKEFVHNWGLSEPLDWQSEWCAPVWRIGT